MPTFPWLPEEQNETDAQITDTIPKEVLAPTGTCHQLHPSASQPQAAPQARTRRLCGSASVQHARKPTAAPELGGTSLALERTSPERAGAGVYLSHLLTARGRQARTTLCFTSFLLPQPESTQPPKAASPVTTTTNKQPPARSHCAGARQRREQRSAAGAD